MSTAGSQGDTVRRRHTYGGAIQGVGFRPAVFRCAASLGLSGFVRNERSTVVVEVQGPSSRVLAFPDALARALPRAARVDRAGVEEMEPAAEASGFRIEESLRTDFTLPPIPADLAVCPDCARELLDPRDRRYLYPFITCTQCGPRYSITLDTPFDRARTTMAAFPQCPECEREYADPASRRFHAQTNACPRCGPRLQGLGARGERLPGDPVREAIGALASGRTVALLGLGGFHLAADPRNAGAIARLRADKHRERKPLALMVRDLDVARRLCHVDQVASTVLDSAASPIVVLPAREGAGEHLRAVSDTGTLGLMLPYTPLHLLLFRHPDASVPYDHLVMTSGNLHDEPIITDPDEGIRCLGGLADLFLVHERRIAFRSDDTVVRVMAEPSEPPPTCLFRRSRGSVPDAIHLARAIPESTLAAGGDLKSAPALACGSEVSVSAHIGDLDSVTAFDAFEEEIAGMLERLPSRPTRIVHDLHPLYQSTRWARRLPWGTKVPLQHHHAHVLSVMAEQGVEECLGLAFDGTGYGTDGTIWGGELLHAFRSRFVRLGSFAPFALPGGEAAILRPARIAFALLHRRFPEEAARLPLAAAERELLSRTVGQSELAPPASSVGRIFDAAAAALGVVDLVSYEGEGPMRLEGIASRASPEGVPSDPDTLASLVPLVRGEGPFRLDAAPLIARLLRSPRSGADSLALLFHRAMADAAVRGARLMREQTGLEIVALSGGVFQNSLFRSLLIPALRREGFRVMTNRLVPVGDGGLSLGQAWYLGELA